MERASERRSAARTAVVWEAVQQALRDGPARILDVGGGTGGLAVRLAGLGHDVTVVDPSPDALAALGRRAAEAEVAERVAGLQGDLATLLDVVPPAGADGSGRSGETTGFDLVLCHGVLGLLAEPVTGLETIAATLRPGGTLSLVVAQVHAAVVARAVAGHFRAARAVLESVLDTGAEAAARPAGEVRVGAREEERRFTAERVADLLGRSGLTVDRVQGIRVFADLVPGALLDSEAGGTGALLDLERLAADRPEYLPLAAQLHVLASR